MSSEKDRNVYRSLFSLIDGLRPTYYDFTSRGDPTDERYEKIETYHIFYHGLRERRGQEDPRERSGDDDQWLELEHNPRVGQEKNLINMIITKRQLNTIFIYKVGFESLPAMPHGMPAQQFPFSASDTCRINETQRLIT
ncbi:hypothetical protein YC2023_073261 [Brassica napus]